MSKILTFQLANILRNELPSEGEGVHPFKIVPEVLEKNCITIPIIIALDFEDFYHIL